MPLAAGLISSTAVGGNALDAWLEPPAPPQPLPPPTACCCPHPHCLQPPWWLRWLQWPQQLASRVQQACLEARLRQQMWEATLAEGERSSQR